MKLEPWILPAYEVLRAAGKPQYYLLLSEDEVLALSFGVVLSRTCVQARHALDTLDTECARHARARSRTHVRETSRRARIAVDVQAAARREAPIETDPDVPVQRGDD